MLDISGTSRTDDSVRRRAHAPQVTGTTYIFVRQDVCAWKRESCPRRYSFHPLGQPEPL